MSPGDDPDFEDVMAELFRARQTYPRFNSAHEGFAILLEEVDELWEEVRKKPSKRSKARLRAEAKQIAAMAIRFMKDVCE